MTPREAAEAVLLRRQARTNLDSWVRLVGHKPALHHELIIKKLQEITDSPTSKYVMILLPPGAAKSTYASVDFPPWYLAKRPGSNILACSYSYTLAESFGRRARNLVVERSNALGYSLRLDSKASGEWETTTNGRYFCAGVGAGIAGHRADLGLIDDYLGNQEDADSKNTRDKQWDWFWTDFFPRLKPNSSIVIIANRRHEDDLVGRLLDDKREDIPILAKDWEVIRIPFFAEEGDVLGRPRGARLWPEWFTERQADQISRLSPRLKAGLYQQRPAPEDGDFFRKDWFNEYRSMADLPTDLTIYTASDHAISKREDANQSCFITVGVDSQDRIWVLPQVVWKRMTSDEQVDEMIRIQRMYKPKIWWAEKGHITQALGPFLRKRMREEKCFINIREVIPKKDKSTRARAIQGRMGMGMVFFPAFAEWYADAKNQMLSFPMSKEDDFVDAMAHIGRGIDMMSRPEIELDEPENFNLDVPLTYDWIKAADRRRSYRETLKEYA
jgi:predicted phage terminase large subunit-like protein